MKRLPAAFYALASGREPVREWLKELDRRDRKLVGEDIKDVEFSWPIGMPLCRSLGGGLWEVRSDLTQGRIARAGRRARSRREAHEGDFMKKKGRIGSSFDDFLKDEGIYEDVTAKAIKRVIARQLGAVMRENHLTKSMLARRMRTSRAQLDRLLDPDNDSVTLGTLARAAHAVGRNLRMELV